VGDEGDKGDKGDKGAKEMSFSPLLLCPWIPWSLFCPMPNAQCPFNDC